MEIIKNMLLNFLNVKKQLLVSYQYKIQYNIRVSCKLLQYYECDINMYVVSLMIIKIY